MAYRKLSLVGTVLLLGFCGGCGSASTNTSPAARSVPWVGRGGGFAEWGCGGDFVYAQSLEPPALEVMQWRNGTLEKCGELAFEQRMHPVCTATARMVCCRLGQPVGAPAVLEMSNLPDGSTCEHVPCPGGWRCPVMSPSRNGVYVAMASRERISRPPPEHDPKKERMNVGLIGPGIDSVCWKVILSGTGAETDIRSAVPSDDGTFVAVAAWEGGVAMVDMQAGQELWSIKPGSNAVQYVAFSPDSKIVYAGGTEGVVYGMDIATGKVLSKWYATSSGREEYGERISCLAVSPDGRWVAAGTGPSGLVYVGSTATNKLVRVLNHGGGTIALVHFSPDSQALASFVPGALKVWKVSEWK